MSEEATQNQEATATAPAIVPMSGVNGILLHKKRHDVTAFASEDESRFALCGVNINLEKRRIEACDGKMLITVPITEDALEFPKNGSEPMPVKSGIIQRAKYEAGLKAIPKKAGNLPVLENMRVGMNANEDFQIEATDLDNRTHINAGKVEANYPNIDQVMPDLGTYEKTITLSPELLRRVCDYAIKAWDGHTVKGITFRIKDEVSPAHFTVDLGHGNGKAEGLIMPMRMV